MKEISFTNEILIKRSLITNIASQKRRLKQIILTNFNFKNSFTITDSDRFVLKFVKEPTTPQTCRYTSLYNILVRKVVCPEHLLKYKLATVARNLRTASWEVPDLLTY